MFGVSFDTPTERDMGLELINDGSVEDGKLIARSEMISADSVSNAVVVFRLLTCNKDYYEFHRTAYS
jgi:hypothetical protein